MKPGPRQQAAFSLVELMIGILVLGILASLALPSFSRMIKDNRRAVVVNELLANVLLAREEAAKRGQSVVICGGTAATCAGTGTWDSGWQVFVDANGTGNIESDATSGGVTYDETALVLRRYANTYPTIRVRSDASGGGLATGSVSLKPFSQIGSAASLLVCDERGSSQARVVCIAANGRATSQSTNCTTGAALVCP